MIHRFLGALLTALVTGCALLCCRKKEGGATRAAAKAAAPKEAGIRHSAEVWLARRRAAKSG